MPGIDQLKQFDKDITPVGEELELRKKSGTTLPAFAMPVNVPAADDSLDFEFGLPVKEEPQESGEEAADAGEGAAASDAAESAVQDVPIDSTLPDETPIPSLDDLDPDIAAFLSGTKPVISKGTPAAEEPEDTPADVDKSSSAVGENALDSFDSSDLDGLLAQMEQN